MRHNTMTCECGHKKRSHREAAAECRYCECEQFSPQTIEGEDRDTGNLLADAIEAGGKARDAVNELFRDEEGKPINLMTNEDMELMAEFAEITKSKQAERLYDHWIDCKGYSDVHRGRKFQRFVDGGRPFIWVERMVGDKVVEERKVIDDPNIPDSPAVVEAIRRGEKFVGSHEIGRFVTAQDEFQVTRCEACQVMQQRKSKKTSPARIRKMRMRQVMHAKRVLDILEISKKTGVQPTPTMMAKFKVVLEEGRQAAQALKEEEGEN